MNPGDFIGNVVLIGSVILVVVAVVWLPILRRRELAQIAEEKGKPIFVELYGSTHFNADGTARSDAILDLSSNTNISLKLRKIPDSEEADVEVFTASGQSLGTLPAIPGRELAKEIAADKRIEAKIDLISGGTEREPDYYIKLVLKRKFAQTGRRR
jgi:hypothetical protein